MRNQVLQYLKTQKASTLYNIVIALNSDYKTIADAIDGLKEDGLITNDIRNGEIVYYVL